ncbi:MAG: HAMP domain-containing sensor histidine kinase [Candidatus Electrothrix sp. GW3-4]|uniref:sensor histidine kinase n=1 Tax=Candidatus Electrothrix sp. GW3-4 TaxID=3126740 RepID=UPI0030CE49E8
MTKPTSTLFTKILSWFFLNMLLVLAVLTLFFAFQPQFRLHELFGQQGSDRLRVAGMLISHDLSQAQPEEWPDILARHSSINGVDFIVIQRNGTILSPTLKTLPKQIMLRSEEALRRRRPGSWRERFAQKSADLNKKCGSQEIKNCPNNFPRKWHGKRPHLFMRTKEPTRYWFGTKLPLFSDPRQPPEFGLLLAYSDSITGNGFFFDPLPWMVVSAAVLLISVLLWIPLVRHITKPIIRMTRAAEEIAKGNFNVSINEPRADEIGRLATTINHMATRLDEFVKGQKRFLGDAAHELGSPVARIQFGLGVLEQRLEGGNQERVQDVMEDVEEMSKLIRELLAFSRADMNSGAIELEQILLLPVVEAAVRREATPTVQIDVQTDPGISALASADLLTRALANLLRNAVKYAGEAGPITVTAQEKDGQVILIVKDSGPGVAKEYLDRLFDPFFRPEPSRDRDSGGVGLGMAIVKTCVAACKGTVSARNREPKGFAVTIILEC